MSRVTTTLPRAGDARGAASVNTPLAALETALGAVDGNNFRYGGLGRRAFDPEAHSSYQFAQGYAFFSSNSANSGAIGTSYAQLDLGGVGVRLAFGGSGFTVPAHAVAILEYSLQALGAGPAYNGVVAADLMETMLYYQPTGGSPTTLPKSHDWLYGDASNGGQGSLGGFAVLEPDTYDWVEIRIKSAPTGGGRIEGGHLSMRILNKVL